MRRLRNGAKYHIRKLIFGVINSMKLLIDEKELKSYKCREGIPCECQNCSGEFKVPKNTVLRALSATKEKDRHGVTKGKFCSIVCQKEYWAKNKTGKNYECKQCGKMTYRKLSGILKNIFCCQSCAANYNNAHKKHGTKRSKLEVWLEAEIIKLYPNLEVHFNKKDTINGELDIYIPSLRLAFELNGIFHYEPIYGAEKLARIQNNDGRKFQACLERKIELCTIDTSNQKYFKIENSKKYLDIITNIINQKIGASYRGEPITC